ncbi:MAG TPA: hypothetical protein VNL13_00210 [Sulfolobales archaeon]|nr:hypothetical protein [Sulfolobales archaeon]
MRSIDEEKKGRGERKKRKKDKKKINRVEKGFPDPRLLVRG